MNKNMDAMNRAFNKALAMTNIPVWNRVHCPYKDHSHQVMARMLELLKCTEKEKRFYLQHTEGSPTQRFRHIVGLQDWDR